MRHPRDLGMIPHEPVDPQYGDSISIVFQKFNAILLQRNYATLFPSTGWPWPALLPTLLAPLPTLPAPGNNWPGAGAPCAVDAKTKVKDSAAET